MEDVSERYRFEPLLRWNPLVQDYFSKAYGPHHFARISKALTYVSPLIPFLLALKIFLLFDSFGSWESAEKEEEKKKKQKNKEPQLY